MAEQLAVILRGLADGVDVLARHDEDVHGRLGIDVGEGVSERILEDGCGRNLAGDNFAEDAAHGGTSVQEEESVQERATGLRARAKKLRRARICLHLIKGTRRGRCSLNGSFREAQPRWWGPHPCRWRQEEKVDWHRPSPKAMSNRGSLYSFPASAAPAAVEGPSE